VSLRFEELDRSPTPIGEVSLRRRRAPGSCVDIFEVKLGDEFLMSSLFTVAEVELAGWPWTDCTDRISTSPSVDWGSASPLRPCSPTSACVTWWSWMRSNR
jgi:hypothetical protein